MSTILNTSKTKSVETVNNQINGAVITETIFIGTATAFAIVSG